MANTIKLKRSTQAGKVPVFGDLEVGELAVNTADGILYTKHSNNTIKTISAARLQDVMYVSKNGSDANNGSLASPFLTIKAAMAAATAGTSVHISPGHYVEDTPITVPANVSLLGDNLRSVSITPTTPANNLFYLQAGVYVWGVTIKDYLGAGFSYDPTTPTLAVYVSPYLQNITSNTTTGTAVLIDGSSTSSSSTKAMIVEYFTITNSGGVGVHILNSGYSQLVNIYTIACNKSIFCESGGFCTLNGSNSSIGNYGLVADGIGPLLAEGITYGNSQLGVFQIRNLTHIPHVNQTMVINGDNSFYSINTITQVDGVTWQVTIQEIYTGVLPASTVVSFYQRSAIIASAHTFGYVGAGINPATALPQYGGIPIEENEVVMTNGGRVTYSSTDHKGTFKIGSNLTINQATGTISGESFSKSMISLMTPLILALQ